MKKFFSFFIIALSIILTLSVLSSCGIADLSDIWGSNGDETSDTSYLSSAEFHFIDVGQGDAVLVRTADGDILIDAGTNSSENALRLYLNNLGVKKLSYAIFTHPHEDHIGGADMIIKEYTVDNVLLPARTATTKTYTNMLSAIAAKNITPIEAKSGNKYFFGELVINILGPVRNDYKNTNDHSIVVLLEWGNSRVMLAGDAELEAEEDILKKFGNSNISCDLLKLGHHGSSTSSGDAWLKKLSPKIGVITCGKDNEYGHPHAEIINRLNKYGIKICRTDISGDIVFVSDGNILSQKSN